MLSKNSPEWNRFRFCYTMDIMLTKRNKDNSLAIGWQEF